MPLIIDPAKFLNEENTRIAKYYSTNKKKLAGFADKASFTSWYFAELYTHEKKCHYCHTSILEIRHLLNRGIIDGRRVKAGALRGPNFEIDRKDPNGAYTEDNCVLSCYYCNNDKSNTYSYAIYKNYIGPLRNDMWTSLKKIA